MGMEGDSEATKASLAFFFWLKAHLPRSHQGYQGIVYIIHRPRETMQRASRLSTLLQLPSQPTQNMIKDPIALPVGSNARTPHPSRLTRTLRLHGLSPHAPTTTLRERERSAPVHLRRTAHALRWRGRRRANRLVGPPMLLGVQLLLSLLLLLLVLFGEAADDMGGDFVVGGRLVVFSGNINSEFLLRVRNIV
jgi:hypothetical protein